METKTSDKTTVDTGDLKTAEAAAEAKLLQKRIDQGIAIYRRSLKGMSKNELVRKHLQTISEFAYLRTKFEIFKNQVESEKEGKNSEVVS